MVFVMNEVPVFWWRTDAGAREMLRATKKNIAHSDKNVYLIGILQFYLFVLPIQKQNQLDYA